MRKCVVYIADDDDAVRASCRLLLEIHGYVVGDYANGSELLSAISGQMVDCLVLDFHLPDMTGLDLLMRLRAMGVLAPAILVSADANLGRLSDRFGSAGIAEVFPKPPELDRLLATIEKATSPG